MRWHAPSHVKTGQQADPNARCVAQSIEASTTLVGSQRVFWKLPDLCIGSLACRLSGINSQVLYAQRIAFRPSTSPPQLLTWLMHTLNPIVFVVRERKALPDCVQWLCADLCTQTPCLHRQAWTGSYFATPVRRVIDKAMHPLQGRRPDARKCRA